MDNWFRYYCKRNIPVFVISKDITGPFKGMLKEKAKLCGCF